MGGGEFTVQARYLGDLVDVSVWGNVPCVSKIDTLDFSTVYSNRISELSRDYLVNRPTAV